MTTNRTEVSVKNGIKILKKAIKGGISVSEACRQSNVGRNYVSDVKSRIKDNYKNKSITKDVYTEFTGLVKQYDNQ